MSNRDVVLVRPWAPSAAPVGSLVEDALGVGYLAAALREAGYSVAVLDAFTYGLNDRQVAECIASLNPRVVGVSLHSFADYRHTVAICSLLAAREPRIYRVVGGEHATFLAREILGRHPCIDAVVVGEGERTIVELVASCLAGRLDEPIAGTLRRSDSGELLDGGSRPPIEDLDVLPFPSKDIVEAAIGARRSVALSVLTGRGCTHKCTFCTANTYLRMGKGVVWRRRRPDRVADEIEQLVAEYGDHSAVHPMLQFQDVIFLGTSPAARNWTRCFVEELERRNLHTPFYFMSRAEAILANEDLLPRLVASGLASVEVGIESGVDRILQSYDKQNVASLTERAIKVLQKHHICYDASGFIMFDPHITLDELEVNACFLRRLGHATWDRYVTKLQVFPGTAIRPKLISEGLFRDDAGLDDVYAYTYEDSRVADVASHAFMYDESVRALDARVHNTRFALRGDDVSSDKAQAFRMLTETAEAVYCDFFLSLVDLARKAEISVAFQSHLRHFLARVRTLEAHFASMELVETVENLDTDQSSESEEWVSPTM